MRVMWLLNHSAARKFEIPMLKRIGVKEVFLPKIIPDDHSFRSSSVDWSEDQYLSIPKNDLDTLNSVNWYTGGHRQAWELANEYFDACFFILHDPDAIRIAAKHFDGVFLWRAYGLDKSLSYSKIVSNLTQTRGLGWKDINRIGNRFFFAKAYDHIDSLEATTLRKKSLYLPLGLHDVDTTNQWQGSDKRIFFICPEIGFNPYYGIIYNKFISDFSGFPYSIGGAQPISVEDPAVLGFTPLAIHERNMCQLRLMFYHSDEPNHIHYHPFEAIRAGMPLVFMAGGLLDRIGGVGLPGRCETVREARAKIERILNDDWKLIDSIRKSQSVLLEPMKSENCEQAWRDGVRRIAAEVEISRAEKVRRTLPRKRIAVIVPVAYRGGSLRGAKLLAQAIFEGSRQFNEAAEVVLLHLDATESSYPESEFADLPLAISRRTFRWVTLRADAARRAMRYGQYEGWEPQAPNYIVADDGIKQLQDCDLWIVVSDRLTAPLLPLRPCVHMVYDYLQRYVPILPHGADQSFIDATRSAELVLVTTEFTRRDALQYAGLPPSKVIKLPMLAPDFSGHSVSLPSSEPTYFLWTTNASLHKNHECALQALRQYYEELAGKLDCVVTGVNTATFLKSQLPHLASAIAVVNASEALCQRVRWLGELAEKDFKDTLAGAAFLWHAGRIDNGTFSVIEAASLGVPALSSDYPAMREIDEQFALNLAWMDANDPSAMADQLKKMESTYFAQRDFLPSKAQLASQNVDRLAGEYWKVVRECL